MPIQGEKFVANKTTSTQERISSDAVREVLTPEQLKRVINVLDVTQLRVTRISGEKAKFKMPNLSNATKEGLVDMLGEVREQMADLKKLEGIYKEALEARLKE